MPLSSSNPQVGTYFVAGLKQEDLENLARYAPPAATFVEVAGGLPELSADSIIITDWAGLTSPEFTAAYCGQVPTLLALDNPGAWARMGVEVATSPQELKTQLQAALEQVEAGQTQLMQQSDALAAAHIALDDLQRKYDELAYTIPRRVVSKLRRMGRKARRGLGQKRREFKRRMGR